MKIVKSFHSTKNKTISTALKMDSSWGENNDMIFNCFVIGRENSSWYFEVKYNF